MKRQSVDSHVKDFYQDVELSPQKCQQMMEQAEWLSKNTGRSEKVHEKKSRIDWGGVLPWSNHLAWGGAVLTLVFIAFVLSPMQQAQQREYLVAKEIALNHNKHLDSDFAYDSVKQLNQVMSKLDFSLVESDLLKQKGLTLAGGRYCSIQGHMAAQLRFYDDQQKRYTLYQVGMEEEFEALRKSVIAVDGASVEVWQESGNLFGLARTD